MKRQKHMIVGYALVALIGVGLGDYYVTEFTSKTGDQQGGGGAVPRTKQENGNEPKQETIGDPPVRTKVPESMNTTTKAPSASKALETSVGGGDASLIPHCPANDALGTSRVISVGTEGGLEVGLKSYPRSLDLSDHEVVLTFDDGPQPGTTERILDALKRECVRATFFLIGRNAEAHPRLVRREIEAGHTVAHHTWSHPVVTLRGMSDAAARAEIERGILADERAGATGRSVARVPFFRFPGFADTKPLREWLASRNVAVFGADLWASDRRPMTPTFQLKQMFARLEELGRGIILFHDTRNQTAAMIPEFLKELKRRKYSVVHLIPGAGRVKTVEAAQGWSSETESILSRVYPVHVITRKSLGEMTRKLSVTESQKSVQFLGTLSRKKSSVASANCPHVA